MKQQSQGLYHKPAWMLSYNCFMQPHPPHTPSRQQELPAKLGRLPAVAPHKRPRGTGGADLSWVGDDNGGDGVSRVRGNAVPIAISVLPSEPFRKSLWFARAERPVTRTELIIVVWLQW